MFVSYSWSGFLWVTLLITVSYYLFLGWLYCRKDIYHFLFYKRDLLRDAIQAPVQPMPDPIQKVHELVSELGIVIRNAGDEKPPKSELLFALQQRIKDFSILEKTEYKRKINLYIAEELEIHGIQGISIEDIEILWKA